MICEMCGRDGGRLTRITVEGSLLSVCSSCAKFGDEYVSKTTEGALGPSSTIAQRLEIRDKRMKTKDVFKQFSSLELKSDYPNIIRSTRQRMGMTVEDLGKKLNEKKSVISKLEHGELRPNNQLIDKLEKTLKVALREPVEDVHVQRTGSGSGLTLGDFIKTERK